MLTKNLTGKPKALPITRLKLGMLVLGIWPTFGIFFLIAITTGANAQEVAPWSPWSKPYRLLPYMRDAVLTQNPVDLSLGYVGANGAYGIVAGSEAANWNHDVYTKLSDQAPPDNAGYPGGVYDEFGTLHAVWGGRAESGQFRLYYNRILKGGNNVGQPRDLTKELMPQSEDYFGDGFIDYSRQQKKLFAIFTTRDTNQIPSTEQVYFSESADQGTTWNSPLKLGEMSGYAPGRPELVVDQNGNPHIFYGVMAADDSRSWYYHRMRVNGNWSAPQDITDGTRYRLFTPKVALGPDGDIWVAWTAAQIDVAHWESQSNSWQTFNSVSGKGTNTGWPAIAVGAGGAVWVSWIERGSDNIGDWQLRFTIYREGNWIPAQVGFVFKDKLVAKDLPWTRVGCLNAIYAKGLIYLGMCIAVDDPQSVSVGLWLTTVPEGWYPGQVLPTPTPVVTSPLATSTPTNPAGANSTTRVAASITLTPTETANPGSGENISSATKPTPMNTRPSALSPQSSPTLAPELVKATEVAQAQAKAALTPVKVPMPLKPVGSGIGPELVLPTATPTPNPTVTPSPKPTLTPVVRTTSVAGKESGSNGAPGVITPSSGAGTKTSETSKQLPPTPGPLVWPILSGLSIGWGSMNLLSRRRLKKRLLKGVSPSTR